MQLLHEIILDLEGQSGTPVVQVVQNDRASHIIQCGFTSAGRPVEIPGGTVARLVLDKPDGKQILNDEDSTPVVNGKIIFTLTQQASIVPGEARAMVKLYGPGDTLLSSACFIIEIQEDLLNVSSVESSNEFMSLTTALNRVQSAGQDAVSEAKGYAEKAKLEVSAAAAEKNTAKQHADKAEQEAKSAAVSQKSASQALADLLKMLGNDIAPLVDGMLPMSVIPATATQEIYEVTSEADLISLTAQRGDLAELVEPVDGEPTITKTWQLLGSDPAIRSNWVIWGTSYAVQAGYASMAGNAENAAAVNGHRVAQMTYEAFEAAVKDPDTYYIVYAPEVTA